MQALCYDQRFVFTFVLNGSEEKINIDLKVSISKEVSHTGTHVWDSSIVLTNYLLSEMTSNFQHIGLQQDGSRGLHVLELGCGLGLPSLVNCKFSEKNFSIFTDIPDLYERCSTQCEVNKVPLSQYKIVPLEWGHNFLGIAEVEDEIDLVIASDCLYDKKLYDDFFATFAFLKHHFNNPDLPLVLVYYKRNESDNISYQLRKWNLKATLLDWHSTMSLEQYLNIVGNVGDKKQLEQQYHSIFEATQILLIV